MKMNCIYITALLLPLLANSQPLDPSFPYGSKPKGNVCVHDDYYATPETMLGSWAMLKAVEMDQGKVLPQFLTSDNVVYAVGTAAINKNLGVHDPDCDYNSGCDALNGFCFALKFNDKNDPNNKYQYMIFQSVNIGANTDSFDIYMAGGGSGAFPKSCPKFWGTKTFPWENHIQDKPFLGSCTEYFKNLDVEKSAYYGYQSGKIKQHNALDTLKEACEFACDISGFCKKNWGHISKISVVPVTCPKSLTQITGIALVEPDKVGTVPVIKLQDLTEAAFKTSKIHATSTQMQDCKTPSSGYCKKPAVPRVPGYEASISAGLKGPLLKAPLSVSEYCKAHENGQFCSWDGGITTGGSYCNEGSTPQQKKERCLSCANNPTWCTCTGFKLQACVNK